MLNSMRCSANNFAQKYLFKGDSQDHDVDVLSQLSDEEDQEASCEDESFNGDASQATLEQDEIYHHLNYEA
jgi:hypothetical protein